MTEPSDQSFVRLRVVQSLFEAQRAQAILEDAGIPVMVTSYRDTAMDGLYQAQKGWGEVRVPEEQKAEAEKLLAEALPAATAVGEEELASEAMSKSLPEVQRKPALTTFELVVVVLLVIYGIAILYLLYEKWS